MLQINELNACNSIKMYLDKIGILSNTDAPLKKINKYKLKFRSKPWITLGLQKSTSEKQVSYQFHSKEGSYTKRGISL